MAPMSPAYAIVSKMATGSGATEDGENAIAPRPSAEQDSMAEDLYVVTENGEQCFLWRSNQLTYIAQERHEIPAILATKFGRLATRLDLSYNSLTSFKNINSFTNLNELILDNNLLEDDQVDFRVNLRLKTLSLNKNRLANLYKLVSTIKVRLPNLEYLSLIGNPLCPGPLLVKAAATSARAVAATSGRLAQQDDKIHELVLEPAGLASGQIRAPLAVTDGAADEFSQQKYRHFIIYHLPNLRFLDSRPITAGERDEALRRCFWMSQATSNQLNEPGRTRTSGVRRATGAGAPGTSRQRHHSEESAGSASGQVDGQFRLTIMLGGANDTSAGGGMENNEAAGQPRSVFSRLAYKYTGRNSEGNRFIRNKDL